MLREEISKSYLLHEPSVRKQNVLRFMPPHHVTVSTALCDNHPVRRSVAVSHMNTRVIVLVVSVQVPPMSAQKAEAMLKKELHVQDVHEVFEWIDLDNPLGSASIAQVCCRCGVDKLFCCNQLGPKRML